VEFKNDLRDPEWLPLSGSLRFSGGHGYATDLAPHPVQRFYRIRAGFAE
jgi:cell wall assembly regulator SMI1